MSKKHKILLLLKKNFPIILLCSLAFILTIIQSKRFTPLIDYTYQVENAYRIFKGEVPYKDFFLVLTPGTYYIMALLMKINNGYNHQFQLIFTALFSGIYVYLTYFVLQKLFNQKVLNYFLTLSTIFTGYVIYPYPLYNNDVAIFMLFSLYIFLSLNWNKHSSRQFFLAGIAACLPALFKQNTGLIFLFLTSLAFIIPDLIKNKFKNSSLTLSYIAGVLFVILLFTLWLISNHALNDFVFQTFTYPAQARTPGSAFGKIILSFITEKFSIILVPWVIAAYLNALFNNKFALKEISFFFLFILSALIIPFYYIGGNVTINNWQEMAYYYSPEAIWYTMILISSYIAISQLKKNPSFATFLILACIGIAFSAFLSWGVSSGLSVWFLLVIMVSYTSKYFSQNQRDVKWTWVFSAMFILLTFILIIYNYLIPSRNGFLASKDKMQVASTTKLNGLSVRGNYIQNMENLINYTNNTIPKKNKVIIISGEDPFYLATNRINPLRFIQYGVNTYPENFAVDDIIKSKAEWLIIKNKLQINANRTEQYVKTDLIIKNVNIKKSYSIYKTIPGYDIYIRSAK